MKPLHPDAWAHAQKWLTAWWDSSHSLVEFIAKILAQWETLLAECNEITTTKKITVVQGGREDPGQT
jgi:hypothetical protein